MTSRVNKASENNQKANQGTNQSGMRAYNERLILSIIRNHGSLAKADIAKITKLSAQTISVIMRKLEADNLLLRESPLRKGKVGQPLVPMKLNPDGAFFFGLKVGRSSAQLVLIDLLGKVINIESIEYNYPATKHILDFTFRSIEKATQSLAPHEQKRISGIGIALPFKLWMWTDMISDTPKKLQANKYIDVQKAIEELLAWKNIDLQKVIEEKLDYPVFIQNDTTAACGAELAFGNSNNVHDFVYFYIGYFIGGGIVINDSLFSGKSGNAGALGSMPVIGKDGNLCELIDVASIKTLESKLLARNIECDWLWHNPSDWQVDNDAIAEWIDNASHALAHAIISASTVIDFEAAIIDGWLPNNIRHEIVKATRKHITELNAKSIDLPIIEEGLVGVHARSIGGASLPLAKRFLTKA